MIKAILLLVIIIPMITLILFSKYKRYAFVRDLIGGGTPQSRKEILQIKLEYEKFSSEQLFQLLNTKQLSPKECLIIDQILKERS
ncbi:MAG TPA: hypothetical protein VLZ11_05435 [Flavobacterium sp.]|nr:hypothetical protein [Flavobacterium sp.]